MFELILNTGKAAKIEMKCETMKWHRTPQLMFKVLSNIYLWSCRNKGALADADEILT